MVDYVKFLESKKLFVDSVGFRVSADDINIHAKLFQSDIIRWAIQKGRAAVFAGTGLGKTLMSLEWANKVCLQTGGDVLMVAPLAVSQQTLREGQKFGIEVNLCREQADVKPGINITNYEMLHKFNLDHFIGVVLDESSILKSFTGKIRTHIIDSFRQTPYRLACTATPAPNDLMELCNHAEFLGVMKRTEMLSMWFVHDGGDTSKWRLKGHVKESFWTWVASWAVMLQNPSDLGYEDTEYQLPPLNIIPVVVEMDGPEVRTMTERRKARKESVDLRVAAAAEIVNQLDESWLVWCGLNDESDKLTKAIAGAVEIRGSHKPDYKEKTMENFSAGNVPILVSKASICGFGMNFQVCSNMVFVGLSDSFEQWFQAIRRCWRFGQTRPVNVYVVTASTEGAVVENIKRKEEEFNAMLTGVIAATQEITKENIQSTIRDTAAYDPQELMQIPEWLKSA